MQDEAVRVVALLGIPGGYLTYGVRGLQGGLTWDDPMLGTAPNPSNHGGLEALDTGGCVITHEGRSLRLSSTSPSMLSPSPTTTSMIHSSH